MSPCPLFAVWGGDINDSRKGAKMEYKISNGNKPVSLICLIAGVVLLVTALVMDFMGTGNFLRGAFLVIGVIGIIVGLWMFPSEKYHKRIINIIFLFPLLFAFAVTVIIPLVLPRL